jgi:hypothetical protein
MSERSIIRPAVADAVARDGVAAAAHRDEHVVLTGETDAPDDVLGVHASRDDAGTAIYHAVEDLANLVVAAVAGKDDLPWKTS